MADEPDLIGKTFDGYRVIRRLGQGGMGSVYEAFHDFLKRPAAVKVIKAELADNKRSVNRFYREAQALAKLTHPSATTLYTFGEQDDMPYIVLELVRGETLHAVLAKSGAIPPPRAIALTLQILGALEAAHTLRIIHRDLKPENLMITGSPSDERIKLLDFGLSKDLTGSAAGLTAPGAGLGTITYMAPEQIDNALMADERSDLYAAGNVLYEMLAGANPFDGYTVRDIVAKKLKGAPSIRLLRPEIPVSLEQIVTKAIHLDPNERYQDARSFAQALAAARNDAAPDAPARAAVHQSARRYFLEKGEKAGLLAKTVEKPPAFVGKLVGQVLGPYRLEQLLATARTGEVYEALDLGFDRIVAVKVLPEANGALERLRKEAMLLARVGAPTVFDVVETGTQDGLSYLVLLGVSGRPLSDVARETGAFPVERAIACGTSLLATLAELHMLKVTHRDVHAGNILVTVDAHGETFRLLDFTYAADPNLELVRSRDPKADLRAVATLVKKLVAPEDGAVPPALGPVLDHAYKPGFANAREFATALEAARQPSSAQPVAADPGTEQPRAVPGLIVGRYRFSELLGPSSLGEVWRATQLDMKRRVALRVLAPELAADKSLVKEMVRTARIVAKLEHPAVARVHEIVISGPRFVASELVVGRRLADAVREGPFPIDRAVSHAIRLLGAIAEAHANHLIHGCLEPSSVILVPSGDAEAPKIVDFGVEPVRAYAARRPSRAGLSEVGRAYSPPELVSGHIPTEAADLFAVAALLYEMLTGKTMDQLNRSPRRIRPEVPETLDAIVLRALAPRPDTRFADARTFGSALRALT